MEEQKRINRRGLVFVDLLSRLLFREANDKLNNIECESLPEVLKSKPVLLYAESSTFCNIACTICGKSFYKPSKESLGNMKLDLFKKMQGFFEKSSRLALYGYGEPLLNKDFPEMLNIAKKKRIYTSFNTNGNLLTEGIARRIVEKAHDEITISFSGATKETYEKIHYKSNYDKVINNIKRLNQLKKEYNSEKPLLAFEFVAQRSNIEELPDLVRLAKKLEVQHVLVVHLICYDDKMKKEEYLLQSKFQKIKEKNFSKAKKLARELGINIALPEEFDIVKKSKDNKEICLEPWRTFFVRVDGTVSPCCVTRRSLGNLNKQNIWEIWNGEGFKKFRKRMKTSNKPPECKVCHLFADRDGKYDKGVHDKEFLGEL